MSPFLAAAFGDVVAAVSPDASRQAYGVGRICRSIRRPEPGSTREAQQRLRAAQQDGYRHARKLSSMKNLRIRAGALLLEVPGSAAGLIFGRY